MQAAKVAVAIDEIAGGVTKFLKRSQHGRIGDPHAHAREPLAVLVLEPLDAFSTSFLLSYAIVLALLVLGLPLGEAWQDRCRLWPLLPEAERRPWHRAVEAGLRPELKLETEEGSLVRQVAHDYWQQQVLPLASHLVAGLQTWVKGPETLEALLGSLDGDPALQLDPLPSGFAVASPLPDQLEVFWAEAWGRFQACWSAHGRDLEASFCSTAATWREQGFKTTTPYNPKPRKDRCGLVEGWIAAQPPGGDYGATAGRSGGADGPERRSQNAFALSGGSPSP
mgnify:CR=1 FL=1